MSAYIIMCFALLMNSHPVLAQARPISAQGQQALLRVNQFYVVFTNPIVPHVDAGGHMIVSLRPFCDLIGAKCPPQTDQSAMTAALSGHTAQFTAGSRLALIDGRAMMMPIAARRVKTLVAGSLHRVYVPGVSAPPQTQMLIPLGALIQAFHLRSGWKAATRTLQVTGKPASADMQRTGQSAFLPEVTASLWVERIARFEHPDPNDHDLLPVSIYLQQAEPTQLVLRVRNTSGHDLPKGTAAIYLSTDTREISGFPSGSTDIPAAPDPPALPAGASREVRNEIARPSSYYTDYEVAWLIAVRRRQ